MQALLDRSPLHRLFNPESIALFGASDAKNSVGAKVWSNLTTGDFKGRLVPVNPKHKEIGGVACYRSILDVPGDIDLAVIATPARTIPQIIADCGEKRIRNAIVLSAGFVEAGAEGQRLHRQLLDAAHRANMRFLGPNCVGLVRPWLGLNATFLNSGVPQGRLALISQSGALCSAIADWAAPHHLGFSAIVSLGNSADIGFGDALHFLAVDPKTEAILLYVEGVRNAPSFLSALRAAAHTKPVIVLKAGRHNQSSTAAHTHTGALIGSDEVFDAALARAGAVRARTFGQLFAAAEILSANKRSKGNRLGIVTNGGGAGVLAADRAGDMDVDLAAPSEATVTALDKILPPYWSRANPIDILGDAAPDQFKAAVKAALADPNFDGLLVMLTPQAMTDATAVAEAVVSALAEKPTKPVLACWMGESSVAEGRFHLSKNGIPDFTTPERAVEAFSYLAQHYRHRKLALETPGPGNAFSPDLSGARMIIADALSEGRSMLSDIESKALLHAFNIPINVTIEAATPAAAVIAAETVGFPVAMKVNSPDITHKSDVGGVRLNVMNAADVKLAFREIAAGIAKTRADAAFLGVTVERMAHVEDARELVIGASRDPVFGATILFGAGGTMVEVLRDSAVSLPPLNAVLANRLINRTRVSRLLDAFRDRPAVDREAVVEVLLRISDLVCELAEVTELDINPLFAGRDGVIAVDARIAIARPPARSGPYDHVAIHPFPRHLVWKEHLSDGTPLTIRPIRPEDAESEQTFVRELSPEARQFRFMGKLNQLSQEMLVRFTQIDYRREMALVAMTEGPRGPRQQGVARYVINPDMTSCEFAVVVSDEVQKQGIGTRLMKALMEAARDEHSLTVMEGTVLARNASMLQLMAELGFSESPDPDDPGLVFIERAL